MPLKTACFDLFLLRCIFHTNNAVTTFSITCDIVQFYNNVRWSCRRNMIVPS